MDYLIKGCGYTDKVLEWVTLIKEYVVVQVLGWSELPDHGIMYRYGVEVGYPFK